MATPDGTQSSRPGKSTWEVGLHLVALIGGPILLMFGAVGLYEDRDEIPWNLMLVAAGIVLITVAVRAFWKHASVSNDDEEEDGRGNQLFWGTLWIVWGGIKAMAFVHKEYWNFLWVPALIVIFGVVCVVRELRARSAEKARESINEPDGESDQESASDASP